MWSRKSYSTTVSQMCVAHEQGNVTLPVFQRGRAWNKARDQLLILSILDDFSIGMLSMHSTESLKSAKRKPGTTYRIIDGHQRWNAIVSYSKDEFALPRYQVTSPEYIKQMLHIDGIDVSRKRLSQLPGDFQRRFWDYSFLIEQFDTDDEERLVTQFVRYQDGVPLSPQNKREAIPSPLNRLIREVEQALPPRGFKLSSRDVARGSLRYQLARIFAYEHAGRPVESNASALDKFYLSSAFGVLSESDLRITSDAVKRNITLLNRIMPPESVNLSHLLSLYWLVRRIDNYSALAKVTPQKFMRWFDALPSFYELAGGGNLSGVLYVNRAVDALYSDFCQHFSLTPGYTASANYHEARP